MTFSSRYSAVRTSYLPSKRGELRRIGDAERFHELHHRAGRPLGELPVVLNAERGRRDMRAIEFDIADSGSQPLADDVRISPLWGRGDARRGRRHVFADDGEHPADEQLGRPGGERDRPSRLQDAQHLADRHLRPRCEHMSELAHDDVERRVVKRQRLNVSFVPVDLDGCRASRSRAPPQAVRG